MSVGKNNRTGGRRRFWHGMEVLTVSTGAAQPKSKTQFLLSEGREVGRLFECPLPVSRQCSPNVKCLKHVNVCAKTNAYAVCVFSFLFLLHSGESAVFFSSVLFLFYMHAEAYAMLFLFFFHKEEI